MSVRTTLIQLMTLGRTNGVERSEAVDGRDKPGHDGEWSVSAVTKARSQYIAPRAATGHKHSTRPLRTPTYQS